MDDTQIFMEVTVPYKKLFKKRVLELKKKKKLSGISYNGKAYLIDLINYDLKNKIIK